jgi:hypothetical protein
VQLRVVLHITGKSLSIHYKRKTLTTREHSIVSSQAAQYHQEKNTTRQLQQITHTKTEIGHVLWSDSASMSFYNHKPMNGARCHCIILAFNERKYGMIGSSLQ